MKRIYRTITVKLSAVIAIILSISHLGYADTPKVTWNVDFNTTFDNREGDGNLTAAKTYFFTRLAPEVGLKFGKNSRIAGGAVWYQPIGREWGGYRISPTLYYAFESKGLNFAMGMFPRSLLHRELPSFLWSDSLSYSQHNVRGALISYLHQNGFGEAYLDWRGMQTETQREAFAIVAHGEWYPMTAEKPLLVGGHVMMNHFALTANAPEDMHIVDNFLINPYIGVDLSKPLPLDSLTLKGGALITLERNREGSNWNTPCGGWIELQAQWKFIGFKNTFYAGGKLFPEFGRFGNSLYMGEPYYSENLYNRTDIYLYILRRKFVQITGSLDFHVTPNTFMFYQKLTVDIALGGIFGKQ